MIRTKTIKVTITRKLLTRIFSKVTINPMTKCWEWQPSLRNNNGYGQMSIGRETYYSHRVLYALFVEPIAEGMVCDHQCFVRYCCNPIHIKIVDQKTNSKRRQPKSTKVAPLENYLGNYCVHGHLLTKENCYLKNKYWSCRTCKNETNVRYRQKHKIK